MEYTVGQIVDRKEDREHISAVILTVQNDLFGQILELDYIEGGSGWWPAHCVELASE